MDKTAIQQPYVSHLGEVAYFPRWGTCTCTWIAELEELLVGTQPAMGDITKLLANLIGVPAMEEILQKVRLHCYIAAAVNDPELFTAHGDHLWGALCDTFPTNVHPNNVLIEPLGPQENPTAYVAGAHQGWRNATGNDPDSNQMEQSILQAKIQIERFSSSHRQCTLKHTSNVPQTVPISKSPQK